ncbi:alcohol dehydrogenase zinc-binding domain protein [Tolypothrix tenuis PCC 7101]|uniref:Alcohol dehydrogenase zinc-binding domain protein n=1 Tax=Tolypothrix tenuis PCC 7101 TaxID=231146 RepID=A0A1Z4MV51_9CYAN|nr:zinc-binding dehydrogenase [Aulosira sp. FACHB-113]BAY97352.1 alcohol dehydrogenase zinc-binding domain protein [Tolypothrix tenuis PCC 7101]BAZ72139.1 alcohol dehydrogenase zinc-binding domain protein [Aulosira laxa NIES-50]
MKNQCVLVTAKGGSENLKLVEQDISEPKLGQVRIKILATGVSSADILMREGVYPVDPPSFPFVPGYDIVGIIDKCGDGVKKFQVGQKVAALTKIGGYAKFINLSENDLVLMPDGLDPIEAVAVILNYLTAYQILHRIAEVKAGEKVLLYAAAGGVGTAFLQLGQLAGLEMYGTASPGKHQTITELGATPIDYRNGNVEEKIKSLTGDGVDVVLDSIGGENCFRSYQTLRPQGRIVTFGASFILHGQAEPDLQEVFFWWRASLALNLISKDKQVLTYAISTFKQEHHGWYLEDLTTLLKLLAEKKIQPLIDKTMSLSEAREAHHLLDTQAVRGKIVLLP